MSSIKNLFYKPVLVKLINDLIIKNQKLNEELQKNNLDINMSGIQPLNIPGTDQINNIFSNDAIINKDVNELLETVKALLVTKKALTNRINQVNEIKKKQEQEKIAYAYGTSAPPRDPLTWWFGRTIPAGADSIEVKYKKQFNDILTTLAPIRGVIPQPTLKDAYRRLVEALGLIFDNKKDFLDDTGAKLDVSDVSDIKIGDINLTLKDNTTKKPDYEKIDTGSGLTLYDAKLNLINYTRMLLRIILNIISQKMSYDYVRIRRSYIKNEWVHCFEHLLNLKYNRVDLKLTSDKLLQQFKKTNGILKRLNDTTYTTYPIKISTDVTKIVNTPGLIGGFNIGLSDLNSQNDEYYQKYLKYKLKYQKLKAKLESQ